MLANNIKHRPYLVRLLKNENSTYNQTHARNKHYRDIGKR